jgi:hypothetical protein
MKINHKLYIIFTKITHHPNFHFILGLIGLLSLGAYFEHILLTIKKAHEDQLNAVLEELRQITSMVESLKDKLDAFPMEGSENSFVVSTLKDPNSTSFYQSTVVNHPILTAMVVVLIGVGVWFAISYFKGPNNGPDFGGASDKGNTPVSEDLALSGESLAVPNEALAMPDFGPQSVEQATTWTTFVDKTVDKYQMTGKLGDILTKIDNITDGMRAANFPRWEQVSNVFSDPLGAMVKRLDPPQLTCDKTLRVILDITQHIYDYIRSGAITTGSIQNGFVGVVQEIIESNFHDHPENFIEMNNTIIAYLYGELGNTTAIVVEFIVTFIQ